MAILTTCDRCGKIIGAPVRRNYLTNISVTSKHDGDIGEGLEITDHATKVIVEVAVRFINHAETESTPDLCRPCIIEILQLKGHVKEVQIEPDKRQT